jgi:hypothetical protein
MRLRGVITALLSCSLCGCVFNSRMTFPDLFDKGAVVVTGCVESIEDSCVKVVFTEIRHEDDRFTGELNQPVNFLLRTDWDARRFCAGTEVFMIFYVNERSGDRSLLNVKRGRAVRRVLNVELPALGACDYVDVVFLNKRLVVVENAPPYSYNWSNVASDEYLQDFYIMGR